MVKYNLVGYSEKPIIKLIESLKSIEIRQTDATEGLERFPYLVEINDIKYSFQFDPKEKKFYLDEQNKELMDQDLENTNLLIEQLKSEGKSEEEIDEQIIGKGIIHLNRQEYILLYGENNVKDNVSNLIDKFIK